MPIDAKIGEDFEKRLGHVLAQPYESAKEYVPQRRPLNTNYWHRV